jgi:membrane-bound lytic murein transglycosylase D
MQRLIIKLSLISAAVFMFLIFVSSYASETRLNDSISALPQVIRPPDINRQFYWAGEAVPMTSDVKERLDTELMSNSYYHSSTLQYLKRANRYFPMMESILREHGIPEDFKYLSVAESGLLNVSSHASASGFWQFRKLAAKEYGLEVNDEVDERYHVEKATIAACKYLKWLKGKFGTWTDASAAYNVGPTAYKRQMESQKESNFYDLNLNNETSKYVFRLIAIKEIMSRPQDFGFFIEPEEKYPPMDDYYEVQIDKSISNWGDFAHEYGTTYRELKRYNPWLRDNHLTVINNKYIVKVPRT